MNNPWKQPDPRARDYTTPPPGSPSICLVYTAWGSTPEEAAERLERQRTYNAAGRMIYPQQVPLAVTEPFWHVGELIVYG